ncbi:MAG: TolC family protein [Balneolaceae bacterium]
MKILSTLLMLILLPLVSMGQPQKLTLEEAIDIALENNFSLKQAQNNLSVSDMQVTSAYANFFPNLSAGFNGSQNVGRQFIQEDLTFEDRKTYGISGSMNTSVTLFSGFQNINNLRRSRVNHEQQKANVQRIRENIIFNTAMSYLQVLLDMELLEIAEQNLETSRMQEEQVAAQVEVGSRPVGDLYQQQSTVANNELQVVQAENTVNISRTRLVRMLQVDPVEGMELVAPELEELSLIPQDLNLQELINLALNNRKDLEAQMLQIEAARYDLEIAKASRYPSISASAGISSRYSDQYSIYNPELNQSVDVPFNDQFFDQMISRSVGFNISIPIFNRWNTNVSIMQAMVQHKNAQLNLEDVEYGVREEISQAYNDYVSLAKELEATDRALQAAERAYETQQQRYEVGAATLIELNQATSDYTEAQSNRQRTVYNFIFQEKLMDYYIGRLQEADVSL